MSNNEIAKKLLYEFGSAIRGDWSSIDGRWLKNN